VYCKVFNAVCFGHLAFDCFKQTKLAYWFGSYCWGERGAKEFCPGAQDTLATPLARSVEECPFIQDATAA